MGLCGLEQYLASISSMVMNLLFTKIILKTVAALVITVSRILMKIEAVIFGFLRITD
jgi:hypothetical protein